MITFFQTSIYVKYYKGFLGKAIIFLTIPYFFLLFWDFFLFAYIHYKFEYVIYPYKAKATERDA